MLADQAINSRSHIGYNFDMTKKTPKAGSPSPSKRTRTQKGKHPNRPAEIAKERGLRYIDIGDSIGAHEVTIAKLANGTMQLTQEWMEKLAAALKIEPQDLITATPRNLLRVHVRGTLRAGYWSENAEWERAEWQETFVLDTPRNRAMNLYAAQIAGNSMNKRFANGSLIILAESNENPVHGRQYHIRRTRPDGTTEETIKTFTIDSKGKHWFQPESDDPEHQEWIPAEGKDGETIQIIGRVAYAFTDQY